MKNHGTKLSCFLSALLVICILAFVSAPVLADNSQEIVYVTYTGGAYHKDGCGSLWNSKLERTLRQAVEAGYSPCKRCNPPLPDFDYVKLGEKTVRSGGDSTGTKETPYPKTEEPKIARMNSQEKGVSEIIFKVAGVLLAACLSGFVLSWIIEKLYIAIVWVFKKIDRFIEWVENEIQKFVKRIRKK